MATLPQVVAAPGGPPRRAFQSSPAVIAMPRRALRPCGKAGCPELADGRFCPAHERTKKRAPDRHRPSAAKRGYDRRHKEWREVVLARDPLCVICLPQGTVEPSTVADHIVPISRGGARFDLANGQGLCGTCHNRKTARERTDRG